MQIILILFLLNFSQNYYLLSDMKNFDIFIPGGGIKISNFHTPQGMKISNFRTPPGGSKNFITITNFFYIIIIQ